jgi:multiple sugar transport system substrate-binding protein
MEQFTRGELLRRAGSVAASIGLAGGGAGRVFYGPLKFKGRELKGDLSIIQWAHFVPAYDAWLGDYARAWGQQNDVQVTIDHINNQLLQARATAEVAAQSGHDLFEHLAPPASFEDQVIDHRPIVEEITHKVGKIGSLGRRSTYNPRTKKWFGLTHGSSPGRCRSTRSIRPAPSPDSFGSSGCPPRTAPRGCSASAPRPAGLLRPSASPHGA